MSYYRKGNGMGFFTPGAVIATAIPQPTAPLPAPLPAFGTRPPEPKCATGAATWNSALNAWQCPAAVPGGAPTLVAAKPGVSRNFLIAIGGALLVGGYLLTRK